MPIAAGIYYVQSDEGLKDQPPVILIHGAGSNHQIWPAALRRLAGQRVLALDLPGHGRSNGLAMQTVAAYAEQIIDFVAAVGHYQAVFVGHAMGGAIALQLAAQYPSNVAGLGLVASGAYFGINSHFLEQLSSSITTNSAVTYFLARAFGLNPAPQWVEQCLRMHSSMRPGVLYSDWRACSDFDLRGSVGNIEAPTWIIAGDNDLITPISYANFLAERLPAARLQVIPGAGHMLLLEQPDKVAQGLQQFLSALAAARFTAAHVQLPVPSQFSTVPKHIS